MPLTAEPTSAQCLNMSKLNLYQCLAVSKPHYEDVFCLGQHVLMDTGSCLMKGVGMAGIEPVPPPPGVVRRRGGLSGMAPGRTALEPCVADSAEAL